MDVPVQTWTRYSSLVKNLPTPQSSLLEDYCLFNRIGDFQAANKVWDDDLYRDEHLFIVSISHIDGVLRQSRYGDASNHLSKYVGLAGDTINVSEKLVLSLMEAYLNVFTCGRLRAAVKVVRSVLGQFSSIEMRDYNDYEMHAIEIGLHVLKFAHNQSTFVTMEDTLFPSQTDRGLSTAWSGYSDWTLFLARNGRHWEAINVIKILSSTQRKEWSIQAYKDLSEVLSQSEKSVLNILSRAALNIALARQLVSKSVNEDALVFIEDAKKCLQNVEKSVNRECCRQRLEVKRVELEITSSEKVAKLLIQTWYELSLAAQSKLEFGIENECLETCMQIMAAYRMNDKMQQYKKRLLVIQEVLEGDISSALSTQCHSWRAGDREHSAQILRYFEGHCHKYPISRFLTHGDDQDLVGWDIPWSVARMAELSYLGYLALNQPEKAAHSHAIAAETMKYVPFSRLAEMGLEDKYAIEWFDPVNIGATTPFEVLQARIMVRYSDTTSNDSSDWYRYRELYPAELQSVILALPFNQSQFENKMTSLRAWVRQEELFDGRSSDYLIGRLYLAHYEHANLTAQSLQIKQRIIQIFDDFVRDLPETSREVQQSFLANILLAQQAICDEQLANLQLNPVLLNFLQGMYQEIIRKYLGSHLASNLPAIGSLYGRVAEIQLRLATSESMLQNAISVMTQSIAFYDNYRLSMSAMKELPALETKASIREGPVGDQKVLESAISALMRAWLNPNLSEGMKQATAKIVWDFVQKTKNRALNDALSSEGFLSADDRAAVASDAESAQKLRDWQAALEAFTVAARKQHSTATEMFNAQEQLARRERDMSSDPRCAKIIALNKGEPPSIADMSRLFKGVTDRVILVDWFTADVPVAREKIFMITVEILPEPQTPKIHDIELGIAAKMFAWTQKYVTAENAYQNRKSRSAYAELKGLAGLVQPLSEVSKPGDILVFCPTTAHRLHKIPLHAIEMHQSQATTAQPLGIENSIPILRNRVVYTYSQSLLRLSIASRHDSSVPQQSSLILSPLVSEDQVRDVLASRGHSHPTLHGLTENQRRLIAQQILQFTEFLTPRDGDYTTLLTSAEVTKSRVQAAFNKSSFVTFLGHVHSLPLALNSHMLLYHPLSNVLCEDENDPEMILSARNMITATKLPRGAHANLLACGSGVTEARVQNEALGLVPALFHAGARSVLATMWDIEIKTACTWLRALRQAWEGMERRLRRLDAAQSVHTEMIDMAELCKRATKILFDSDGEASIDSWAGFVYSGYWMYPRMDIQVDEEL